MAVSTNFDVLFHTLLNLSELENIKNKKLKTILRVCTFNSYNVQTFPLRGGNSSKAIIHFDTSDVKLHQGITAFESLGK